MRITDLLQADGILLSASPADKKAALDQLADLQMASGNISDKAKYIADLEAREAQGSTAIGEGIAVPHAKSAAVKRPGLSAMTVPAGVDYGAPDGKPSNLFFAIAAPQEGGDVHLEMLSRLMVMLMDADFRARLLSAPDKKVFLALIDQMESEKYPDEAPNAVAAPAPKAADGYRVLAITACPTGIAHTYMAAEALEQKGKDMGIPLKAETQGSGGAKNILTAAEIAAADGIIIAADKNVDLSRFDGKKLLSVPVSDGINKPQELIERVQSAPVYHCKEGSAPADALDNGESIGHKLYKHLMNGVSHMLPFVIGGGILMAISFLLDGAAAGTSAFGSSTMLAAFFNKVGGVAFGFMVPILAAFIAESIADRPGLMVGFVGGSMAATGVTFQYFVDPTFPIVPAGFLGGLVAGFLGGWFMHLLEKLCDKLPHALEGIKPILIYPVVGLLFIGLLMSAINPFVGMLNSAIMNGLSAMAANPALAVLVGALVGGMEAIDMGGPFNKAAYMFGTASLLGASGEALMSPVMAAVMAGGMVPPLAIALASTFFKNRFTAAERKSGPVNYIMGLCFITEGAIPFAASDPLRVIPSCIVGSAVAGALSMLFGCASPAPHGGVFVFPVMQNPLRYIVAVVAGALAGMLMLALLKKKKEA